MPAKLIHTLRPVRNTSARSGSVRTPARPKVFRDRFSLQLVRNLDELRTHVREWEVLANEAVERNVFYEPFMVLPALQHLVADERPEFLLVYGEHREGQGPVLCGMFPVLRKKAVRGPVPTGLELWGYIHCFLRTPLIHRDCATQVLKIFFDWLNDESGTRVFIFRRISADGPFYHALVGRIYERNLPMWVAVNYSRAVMCRGENAEYYIANGVSTGRMKEYRRQERRLRECGALRYKALGPGSDIKPWMDTFITVEGCGWKGRNRSALRSTPQYKKFFESMVRGAHARGQVEMFALRLDGKVIAEKLNLTGGDTGFAFKIGFDERFRRYSPGILLELEHIRRFHQQRRLAWIDSCAEPAHPMIDHLWTERRSIQTLMVGVAPGRGDLMIALAPLLRWFKRRQPWMNRSRNSP